MERKVGKLLQKVNREGENKNKLNGNYEHETENVDQAEEEDVDEEENAEEEMTEKRRKHINRRKNIQK